MERASKIVAPLYEALNQPQKKDVHALLAQACHADYKSYSTNEEWLSRDALAEVFKQIGASVPDLAWSVVGHHGLGRSRDRAWRSDRNPGG